MDNVVELVPNHEGGRAATSQNEIKENVDATFEGTENQAFYLMLCVR